MRNLSVLFTDSFSALRSKGSIRKSGLLRIEPGADRWDARMLPLCYRGPLE